MADITTDVLIIGTGPAGSATAALLATYGLEPLVINRYRWLANTPRAHITNQRTMEVLRDLGRDVEEEAYLFASEQDLMGQNVFCTAVAGEEIGRMQSWGNHPLSRAEHILSSPTRMNDLPQTHMEPLLFKTACSRGAQSRMPHAWLFGPAGEKVSSLDLTGHGAFTILTCIGGDGWIAAAKTLSKELGLPIVSHKIGPRQTWQDFSGDWSRAREIRDSGMLLVRPDHHVAWRAEAAVADPQAELRRVLKTILDR